MPTPGTWRLFLQMKLGGQIVTAPFTFLRAAMSDERMSAAAIRLRLLAAVLALVAGVAAIVIAIELVRSVLS